MPFLDALPEKVAPLLGGFLARQRWYAGDEAPARTRVRVLDATDGDPLFAWLLVDAEATDGATSTYQLVVGGRRDVVGHDFLHGKERLTLGQVDGVTVYDALVDPELALRVLAMVAPDEPARVARPLLVEQTNTSVVFDERLILKLFRRVHTRANPDVEVTATLGARGFPHVVPQLGVRREDGRDLAVVREYLLGATDAWELAHTSLRDLLARPRPPAQAGGDFAPEAAQLGEVVARLHLALAEAYGCRPGDAAAWTRGFRTQIERLRPGLDAADLDLSAVDRAFDDTADVADAGMAVRIHGDLHLGQMLLADRGWFVIDFEGEPARPVEERTVPSSPLRDVAGVLRSFHYAAQTSLAERGRDVDAELVAVADAWEARAADAFWRSYTAADGVASLLPHSDAERNRLLRGFELDKAVYEVGYELSHRPDWVGIPVSAVRRALTHR